MPRPSSRTTAPATAPATARGRAAKTGAQTGAQDGAKVARTPRARPTSAGAAHDLILHVALRDIDPPIWRRLRVPDRLTLHQLHRVLQLAFGWLDYHVYEFTPEGPGTAGGGTRGPRRTGAARVRYAVPDPEWDDGDGAPETRDSREVTLRALALRRGARLTYTYDFGDDWAHDLLVERVVAAPAPDEALPMVLDGARAAPPEDAGGVSGYERLVAVLADPDDPEHAELKAWAALWGGAPYDPARFDPWTANHTLMLVAAWGALEAPDRPE